MTDKIRRFVEANALPTPFLVIDLDVVKQNYISLEGSLPCSKIYYAVKANPAPEILMVLKTLGSCFDVASPYEIDAVLDIGVEPNRISYGNTIKKQADIAYAYKKGVRLFAFDSQEELDKLAIEAPGSKVFCRVLVDNDGAGWPLTRKFGCEAPMAEDLLCQAQERGLVPFGISFHVGSQQTNLVCWDQALSQVHQIYHRLKDRNIILQMINCGGGFPARYQSHVEPVEKYGEAICKAIKHHFGPDHPSLIVEPGRSIAGDAGIISTEVVLISKKSYSDSKRWVYLDIGKFSGLAETLDESIQYRIQTPNPQDPTGPVVLAGPTCDSVDVLYEKNAYHMPMSLKVGDRLEILSAGAYTTTYSSVAFNGFPPLKSYFV